MLGKRKPQSKNQVKKKWQDEFEEEVHDDELADLER